MLSRLVDRSLRLGAAAALAAAVVACAAPPPQRFASASAPSASPTGETEDATTHAPTAKSYTSVHTLNLRTGPNHRFAAKTQLPVGTVVTPNGYVAGSWWQVDTSTYGTGWVDSTGLKPNG